MTTQQVADRLVELSRRGDFETAQNELYTQDALSIEPYETPDFPKETKGLEAIKAKGEKWASMVAETKDLDVSDPLVGTTHFAVTMRMHIVMKNGTEMDMKELCLYQVKEGKVVSEQFFM